MELKGAIGIAFGAYARFINLDSIKVFQCYAKAKTGITGTAKYLPAKSAVDNSFGAALNFSCDGLKCEFSLLVMNGWLTFKTEVPVIDKKIWPTYEWPIFHDTKTDVP